MARAAGKPNAKKAPAKTKAVEAETKAKLPKNPNEYSYRGDEILQIKASDFLLLANAIEIAIQNGVTAEYPTATKYIAAATGIDVPNPTAEEIRTQAVRPLMDIEKTFSRENLEQRYAEWLVPTVINSKNVIFEIHSQNVEAGNAVLAQTLATERAAAQEAARAKAKEAALNTPVVDAEVVEGPETAKQ